MSKYRKLAVAFCMLSSTTSMLFGQAGKTTFTYAPLVGFFSAFAFINLAFFYAIKAYVVEQKQ